MSYHLDQPPVDAMQILARIERGELSVEKALQLITESSSIGEPRLPSWNTHACIHPIPVGFKTWEGWWLLPFWIGVCLMLMGGGLIYLAVQSFAFGFWVFCAGLLSMLGVIILVLAWLSRRSPWLHLRIYNLPGGSPRRFTLSFPIPLKPVILILRTLGTIIPGFKEYPIAKTLWNWVETSTQGESLYFQVDEGHRGANVEIYIG